MAKKTKNVNETLNESENLKTTRSKGVASTDLLESIVAVKELEIIDRELHKIVKKYGVEYQLIVGRKDRTWHSSYEGEGKIINQLGGSSLGYIFLAPRNVPHLPYKK
jgi:hypothetical protein